MSQKRNPRFSDGSDKPESRDQKLYVLASDSEKKSIESAAQAYGLKTGPYLRMIHSMRSIPTTVIDNAEVLRVVTDAIRAHGGDRATVILDACLEGLRGLVPVAKP